MFNIHLTFAYRFKHDQKQATLLLKKYQVTLSSRISKLSRKDIFLQLKLICITCIFMLNLGYKNADGVIKV